jgi:hypothetical protein
MEDDHENNKTGLAFLFIPSLASQSLAQDRAQKRAPIPIPRHEVTILVDIDPASADPTRIGATIAQMFIGRNGLE